MQFVVILIPNTLRYLLLHVIYKIEMYHKITFIIYYEFSVLLFWRNVFSSDQ